MNRPADLDAVGRARVGGEPKAIAFDPAMHPGMAYRLYSMGRTHADVAAAIGIPASKLDVWMEMYPEMYEVRGKALERDAEILKSIEDHAMGEKGADGRYAGGNASLLRFLGETRLGMVKAERAGRKEEDRFDGMTPDQVARRIETRARAVGAERIAYVHPDCGLRVLPRPVADGKLRALAAGRDRYLGRA